MRHVRDLRRHGVDAPRKLLLRLLAVRVPRSRVGPAAGDHGEALDLDRPPLAELDSLGLKHDIVDLELVIVAWPDEDAHARALNLDVGQVHPPLAARAYQLA